MAIYAMTGAAVTTVAALVVIIYRGLSDEP